LRAQLSRGPIEPGRYLEEVFELGTDGPRSVLVGVDGSETSMRAGSYAAGLARRQGAHVIVLFVYTTGGDTALSPELMDL